MRLYVALRDDLKWHGSAACERYCRPAMIEELTSLMSRSPQSAMVMSISLRRMPSAQCHAFFAHGTEAVEEGTADIGALGAERHGLQHVLARADAAVEIDFDLVSDGIDDLRAARLIEERARHRADGRHGWRR